MVNRLVVVLVTVVRRRGLIMVFCCVEPVPVVAFTPEFCRNPSPEPGAGSEV